MKPSEYHAWGVNKDNLSDSPVSNSMLKQFAENPWNWRNYDKEFKSDALTWGSLVDCLLLTPAEFTNEFIVKPDDAPRKPTSAQVNAVKKSEKALESITWWDEFNARMDGKTLIDDYTYNKASNAVRMLKSHSEASEILDGASTQTAIIHEHAGIKFKSLLDIVPENANWDHFLVDLKTTSSKLDDESLSKQIFKYKYHWQAAFYLWLWNKQSKDSRRKFAFIFQNSETHEVRVVELDQSAIESGMIMIKHHITDYMRRVKTNDWASRYATGCDEINLPAFGITSEETEIELHNQN
jgi:hypothetical protein